MRQGAQYAGAITLALLFGALLVFVGVTGRTAVLLGDLITPHDMVDSATA